MKTIMLKTLAMTAVVVMSSQAQAVTLTVSPSAISNTYTGVITLNITGLTNTEKVLVQKWVDANANGQVDAGELLMDQGSIADGGAMVIGGITNINVPFDSNSTTGAITTTLNFPPGIPLEDAWALSGVPLPKDGWIVPSDAPGFGFDIPLDWFTPFDAAGPK